MRTNTSWLATLMSLALITGGCDCGDAAARKGEADGGSDAGDAGDARVSDATPLDCLEACEATHCGQVPDRCGGFLTCPSCQLGDVCGLREANKCGTPESSCTPKPAAEVCPGKCGAVSDGCSGVVQCDASNGGVSCTLDQVCGGTSGDPAQASLCIDKPACVRKTCAELGLACGPASDGCDGTLDCTAETGGCTGGLVCGTGADTGKCVPAVVCPPLDAMTACEGTCGIVGDGCGGQIDCEANPTDPWSCAFKLPGSTCGGGGMPGVCGTGSTTCTPFDVAAVCAGHCGAMPDGCNGVYVCDGSNGGQTCDPNAGETCGGSGAPSVCGAPACTPKTLAAACPQVGGRASCGQVSNGCNSLLDCGGCASDETCGLTTPNVCAPNPVCQRTAIATACAGKCGSVPDGCGGTYTCSSANGGVTCTGNEYCGANAPNTCGTPPSTCTGRTCAQLGHSCGFASDGCGNVINCWPAGQSQCPDPASQACVAGANGALSCVTGTGGCTGALCNSLATCGASSPTRLSGTLLTPGRSTASGYINRIPVPNAIVYIPGDPNVALPSIFQGVQAGNAASCGRCEDEQLVAPGQTVLASAITNARGEFTLQGRIPVNTAFNLVIKAGKWRRVVPVPASVVTTGCATTTLPSGSAYAMLPKNTTDGAAGTQIPRIAISTGDVDAMECVLRNMGIDDTEFTPPTGSGRIHVYLGNGATLPNGNYGTSCDGTFACSAINSRNSCVAAGCAWSAGNCTGAGASCAANGGQGCQDGRAGCSQTYNDQEVSLYRNATRLRSYDLVVFDCQGNENGDYPNYEANVASYVNNGGRLFASHWAYNWITSDATLRMSAAWNGSGDDASDVGYISLPLTPTSPTSRAGANPVKSLIFRDWLQNQAGTITIDANGPHFQLIEPRNLAGATVGSSTDEWMYRTTSTPESPSGTAVVQQLSFNTPYAASSAAICGRVAYSGFHVTATGGNNDALTFPALCNVGNASNGAPRALTSQEKTLAFQLFDLAACVSAGDPPTPPQCTPRTVANTCPNANDACGFVSDGCGGVVDCGGCAAGSYCDGTICKPQVCTPSTCASLGYTCGDAPDGCGGVARDATGSPGCGLCSAGSTCGLGGPGRCGTATCTPYTMAMACPSGTCGQVSDGCGGVIDCGACPPGLVCGGGGPNLCGAGSCTPIPMATACAGKNCGLVANGCGGTYDCGACTLPDTCSGGGTSGVCGHPACTPHTAAEACAGLECGWASDGCGGAVSCGTCPDGRVCGGAGPNLCGAACVPTSCAAKDAECGAIADECNGIIQCGTCPAGQMCGTGGPNKCGSGPACVPLTCADRNANCGLVGDGCGGVIPCGTCTGSQTCGGAGIPNQCGSGPGGCNPLTCAAQSRECGAASDGCGGLLDCGNCGAAAQCINGGCVTLM